MPKTRFVDFVPGWARGGNDAYRSLADTPNLGFEQPSSPRLPTRIVPKDGGNTISAITLSDTVSITQKILNFASYETIYGIHLDFSDVRAMDNPVIQLAKLRVEPFEEGSFIIPAELSEEPVNIEVDGTNKDFFSSAVLDRFVALMEGVAHKGSSFPACFGAVQAIEELGRVLKREAASIEYQPVGFPGFARRPKKISVDDAYIEAVAIAKRLRQDPRLVLDEVTGTLTAVDITLGNLKLNVGSRRSISGTYTPLMEDRMIRSLGKRVRLGGVVEYKSGKAVKGVIDD